MKCESLACPWLHGSTCKAFNDTHHLRPKPMRTWQKRSFTQNDANAKNAPALGVRVPGKGTGYPAPSPQIRT